MSRRILTGMRTTGVLHLGHYVGALERWIEYQNDPNFDNECYFLLADFQALSTHADRPEVMARSVREVVLDWMSVGLDPTRDNVKFVLQSQVTGRMELSLMLQMVARYKDIMDIPTLKHELQDLEDQHRNPTIGFIAYPVDQAADIAMVTPQPPGQWDRILVPVGSDQNPILERCNVIYRTFNAQYQRQVFLQCTAHEGRVGRLPGTGDPDTPEGGKMAKGKSNTINLSDDPATVRGKVHGMYTDRKHEHATDAGDTERNPVFVYLRTFHPDQTRVAQMDKDYRTAGVRLGDVQVKNELASAINQFLDPIRERRAEAERTANVRDIVMTGTKEASDLCVQVVESAREAMHLRFPT